MKMWNPSLISLAIIDLEILIGLYSNPRPSISYRSACAPSEDSDQPAQSCSVISLRRATHEYPRIPSGNCMRSLLFHALSKTVSWCQRRQHFFPFRIDPFPEGKIIMRITLILSLRANKHLKGCLWKQGNINRRVSLFIYIEDIYSFAVNTINIVIECNENISIYTNAKHKWKFECFHFTRWKILWYSL